MDGSRHETEIKLRFGSAAEALSRLRPLGPSLIEGRTFEDNLLLDREREPLTPQDKLLRLRRFGGRSLLTFKAPVEGSSRHKVRVEEETGVDDSESMKRILSELGFSPCFRYQKYRTVFGLEDLHVCLDETPLGCFLELEGAPEAIDRAAARLGFDTADYIRESYGELHEQAAREAGVEPGDMLLPETREEDLSR